MDIFWWFLLINMKHHVSIAKNFLFTFIIKKKALSNKILKNNQNFNFKKLKLKKNVEPNHISLINFLMYI